jgi:RimJ/RimL family protein N-acetyltransferase
VFRPQYPIVTARLILRPFTLADLDDVWAWQSHPDVARFMLWEPRDRERSRKSVEQMVAEDRLIGEGDCLSLAVEWSEPNRVVGSVELVWVSESDRQGEIGFVVHPDFQGRGVAAEAAARMLRLGFEELGLHRIVGRCDARNTGSWRLMARLGMRREAHRVESRRFKGEWCDEFEYAILRREVDES